MGAKKTSYSDVLNIVTRQSGLDDAWRIMCGRVRIFLVFSVAARSALYPLATGLKWPVRG